MSGEDARTWLDILPGEDPRLELRLVWEGQEASVEYYDGESGEWERMDWRAAVTMLARLLAGDPELVFGGPHLGAAGWAASLRARADCLDPRDSLALLDQTLRAYVAEVVAELRRDDLPSGGGVLPRAGNLRPATMAEEAALQPLREVLAQADPNTVADLVVGEVG